MRPASATSAAGDQRDPRRGVAVVPAHARPSPSSPTTPTADASASMIPGTPQRFDLTGPQRALITEADWLCVTIGPVAATRSCARNARSEAKLVWVVKDDPRAMPRDLAARMTARADVICYSQAERAFVDEALRSSVGNARGDQIMIETRGGSGAAASAETEAPSRAYPGRRAGSDRGGRHIRRRCYGGACWRRTGSSRDREGRSSRRSALLAPADEKK